MNNSSAADPFTDEDVSFGFKPEFSYPVAACYIVITAVAVFGNFLVCFAILANKHLRHKPTNLFIFSLALSDFLTATIVIPFDIESLFLKGAWNHGKAFCIVWQVVFTITVPISIFSLLAISVDRYKTLSDPLARFKSSQVMTQTRALIVIAIIWLYCALWPLFVFMGWRDEGEVDDDGICLLPYTKEFTLVMSFVNVILPLMITCVFFLLVYCIAVKNNRYSKRGNFPSIRQPSKEEKKMYLNNVKAAKTTSKFVLTLFLCWQPYCYFVVASIIDGHNWESFPYKVYLVLLMFGYLNSALNPFLFAFSNKSFKAVFKNLLTSLKPAVQRTEPSLSLRRLSTFSQSTITSEIPELGNGVRLQSISYNEDSAF